MPQPLRNGPVDRDGDKRDDCYRTQQAKQVVEEYVRDLRELIKKLCGRMN
jgi:hypothetical protein